MVIPMGGRTNSNETMAVVTFGPDDQIAGCTPAAALRESLRAITGFGIAVRLLDSGDLQLRAANDAFLDLTGLSESELNSARLLDLL